MMKSKMLTTGMDKLNHLNAERRLRENKKLNDQTTDMMVDEYIDTTAQDEIRYSKAKRRIDEMVNKDQIQQLKRKKETDQNIIVNNIRGGNVFTNIRKNKNVQNLTHDLLRIGVNKAKKDRLINNRQADVIRSIGDDAIDSKITSVKRQSKTAGIKTIQGLGLKKGSQEAKDRMKLLRSMRKPKTGNGFEFKNGRLRGNFEKVSAKQYLKKFKQVGATMLKPALDPKFAVAVATGNLPAAGAVYTANVINEVLKSKKVKAKVKDKQVLQAMKMTRGRPVNVEGGSFVGYPVQKGSGFIPY